MKLNNKIAIDLKEFFLTGKFDYLKLGKSKEWILNNFPAPDDYGIGNSLENAKIWRYGNIELHFDKQELFLIFSDYINTIEGGENIDLDKWLLSDPSSLTVSKIIQELTRLKVDFNIRYENNLELLRLRIKKSGVELTFEGETEGEKDPNKFKLGAFDLMER